MVMRRIGEFLLPERENAGNRGARCGWVRFRPLSVALSPEGGEGNSPIRAGVASSAGRRRHGLPAVVVALAVLISAPVPAAEPRRIVAIGGAVTETIHLLGALDRVVAVDSTSSYPAAAGELPDVGYMRQLAAEPIIALGPDLVLAVADAGPPVVFEQLRAAGVEVAKIADDPTPAGVLDKVREVARALGFPRRGRRAAERLQAEFDALRERIAATDRRPRVLVLIAAGPGNLMAAGRDTSATGIIRLAGGRNAIEAYSGFRPLSAEAVIEAQPDWIVMTSGALEGIGGREGLRQRPGLGATPAARDGRIVAMDGLLLLGFGPRTPEAAGELAARLHPGLPAPPD